MIEKLISLMMGYLIRNI